MRPRAGSLAETLAGRLRPAAVAVALIIGAAVPAAYWIMEYRRSWPR